MKERRAAEEAEEASGVGAVEARTGRATAGRRRKEAKSFEAILAGSRGARVVWNVCDEWVAFWEEVRDGRPKLKMVRALAVLEEHQGNLIT